MYQYDTFDRQLVQERVSDFREQTARYLAGELGEEEFKPLRLMNGLYIQRFAPMLRVAIPYGILSSKQLRMLASIAERYDRGYGHFTTRQNIQFNWLALERVPDILADLASVDMHAIQTSGNCIRNITCDHLAGVAPDEVADPRPYCELLRQWSTLHPEFAYLPRKFKIAVTGALRDRAVTEAHDIGLRLVENDAGQLGFEVLVGGGLGRTPVIGKLLREFLPHRYLLSYLQAIMRVYNLEGRRDNKYKARIKILVNALGVEEFRRRVEVEWQVTRNHVAPIDPHELDELRSHFQSPPYRRCVDSGSFETQAAAHAAFARWARFNTVAHRQPRLSVGVHLPQGARRRAGRHDRRADAGTGPSGGSPQLRSDTNQPRPEPGARRCRARRSLHAVVAARDARSGDPEHRHPDQHDLLPGPRFLRSRQRGVHFHRAADQRALRRHGLSARSRRRAHQDFGMRERLRPPSRGAHRHPGRRQERRRVVPDHDRRLGRGAYPSRPEARSRGAQTGGGAHRRRDPRCLPRARRAEERFPDTVERIGVAPFREKVYGGAGS